MIENEIKYVLKLTTNPDDIGGDVEQNFPAHISQGYLDKSARIRKTQFQAPVGLKLRDPFYKFTYKFALPTGEVEEFEKSIGQDEFDRCFELAQNKLFKHRYTFKHDGAQWDLDYFYDPNGTLYFVMAECEMPSGWDKPKSLPKVIRDNILMVVDRNNSAQYSSKKISNVEYAKSLISVFTKVEKVKPRKTRESMREARAALLSK